MSTLARVAFTPVKGTAHVEQPDAHFDAWGPIGDRRYCLVDIGRRRVLRTVVHPELLTVLARLHEDELELTLPDGRSVRGIPGAAGPVGGRARVLECDYWGRRVPLTVHFGAHSELMSSFLQESVVLAEAPRGGVVYGAPLTIVTTASIADLGERAGFGEAADPGELRPSLLDDSARFRATFLVETDEPYAEDAWIGRTLHLGGVTVRVAGPIPRCAVIDLDPATGQRGSRLLKTLASYRERNVAGEPNFGVYAEVVAG